MGDVASSGEDARSALLTRLIDHAPLFPPASMDLPEALEEDQRARAHPAAFMLGRFVCPASSLSELPDVRRGVSVVLDAPLDSGVWLKPDPGGGERPEVSGVWLQPDPGVEVEAIETAGLDDLGALPGLAPEVYVEIPLDTPSRLRSYWFRSIGSCSFFEPVEELEELGMLPL